MAAVLNEPHEPWWQEILDHLPPIATGAPDSIGGGLYWEQASNGLHPDDSLYALFPAETADVLGRYLLRGIYMQTPLRFKLSGRRVLSAHLNVETAGFDPKRPEI
jgi:hypothetical protein